MSSVRASYWLGQAVSQDYAKFRPAQPEAIATAVIKFMQKDCRAEVSEVKATGSRLALDVGCGSGQSSTVWSKYFHHVLGVDTSSSQIEAARTRHKASNIEYHVGTYYDLAPVVSDASCDLVACCQAAHWFELAGFYEEVDRVLVPGGVLAITLYQAPSTNNPRVNAAFNKFYQNLWDTECWDERRQWIENCYEHVKLPYMQQIIQRSNPEFHCVRQMSALEFCGYLSTFSAVKVYREKYGEEKCNSMMENTFTSVREAMNSDGSCENLQVTYPYSLLMCKKPDS